MIYLLGDIGKFRPASAGLGGLFDRKTGIVGSGKEHGHRVRPVRHHNKNGISRNDGY